MSNGLKFLMSDAHGQFLPMHFCERNRPEDWGLGDIDWKVCLIGPDHEHYWEHWESILKSASYIDFDGNVWTLRQESDLWVVCDALMTDKEYSEFFGQCRHCGKHCCFGACVEEVAHA